MHWNGYTDDTRGVGGALGWDGAIRFQWLQLFLRDVIAGVMPGQNMDASALAIIDDTPWWADGLK